MPAANYNFIIEQGSDFEIIFQYNDINNLPIDLSDRCVVLQWTDDTKTTGQSFSSGAGAVYDTNDWSLSGDNSGTIKFKISANLTRNYKFKTAVYDLDIVTPANRLRNTRLATGTITLVTRNMQLLDNCPSSLDPNQVLTTPTITTTGGPSLSPTPTITAEQNIDLCLPEDCLNLDIYSVVYTGQSLALPDLCFVSGSIVNTDIRNIENVEIAINKLQHQSPQDLVLVLAPPSGDPVLLSANSKISYPTSNFSFMFSNKAQPNSYLHNTNNGGLINIYDKSNNINFSDSNLLSGFDHLLGSSVTGNWTLYVKDTDPLGSGYIDSWKLILTYSAE